MSKGKSLPTALKTLLSQPLYGGGAAPMVSTSSAALKVGRSAHPAPPAPKSLLQEAFLGLRSDAESKGVGWGEWLSIATATMVTLNSPSSLAALHHFAANGSSSSQAKLELDQRVQRALLMREVGLKCIGFVGIPKVINNLAALRKAVDEDSELSQALPTEPRRRLEGSDIPSVKKAAYNLWDDIYQPHSDKLIGILGQSHPDLPVFILDGEYGPLFSPPHTFRAGASEPSWEVGRLRTSLVAIAALRAQGGVGPQVTSHVWGLIKAGPSIPAGCENEEGLKWLTTEQGAEWVVKAVNGLSEVVEGHAGAEEEAVKSKL